MGWDFFNREGCAVDAVSQSFRIGSLLVPLGHFPENLRGAPDPLLAVAADFSHLESVSFGARAPPQVVARCRALIQEFHDVFAINEDQFGSANVPPLELVIYDGPPIRTRPYRLSRPDAALIESTVALWLRQGRIRPSSSKHAASCFLVDKPGGGRRLVVDFSRMNQRIVPDNHPSADARNIFDSLAGSQLFSCLDFQWSYLQVPVAESSRQALSFITESGQYEFCFVPFGLNVAGAKLQRELNDLFRGIDHLFGYVDDWTLATDGDIDAHLHLLRTVFTRVRSAGFLLKPSKCVLLAHEVKLLGRIIDAAGHRPDPDDTADLLAKRAPTNASVLRSFFGSSQWLAPYVSNFQSVVAPLRSLLRKGAVWSWSPEHQAAFEAVKLLMADPKHLAFPRFDVPFTLEVDASEVGFGAVLTQQGRPVAFASRATTPSERGGIHATVLELAGLVWALERFHVYLHGRRFRLVTDHRSLAFLKTAKNPSGKFARWAASLAQYDFEIVHRAGRLHAGPDALSRMIAMVMAVLPSAPPPAPPHAPAPGLGVLEPPSPNQFPSTAELLRAQSADPETAKLRAANHDEAFMVSPDGLWCQVFYGHGMPHFRPFVPLPLRARVARAAHVKSGHLAARESIRRASEHYTWPDLHADVKLAVKSCVECGRRKPPGPGRALPLGSLEASRPNEKVAVDVLSLSPSPQGWSYVLTMIDHFSRYAVVAPLRTKSSAEVARAFDASWLSPFGPPESVHSDQGGEFAGTDFSALCRRFSIKRSFTTPYHPQGDGVAERFNRTVIEMLSTLSGSDKSRWPALISAALTAYNSATHSASGQAPFLLWFGRNPPPSEHDRAIASSMPAQFNAAQSSQAEAARSSAASISAGKRAFSAMRSSVAGVVSFKVGDLVWLRNPAIRMEAFAKLKDSWDGPFKVLRVTTPSSYVVQQLQGPKSGTVHIDNLKPYDLPWPPPRLLPPPLAVPPSLAPSAIPRSPAPAGPVPVPVAAPSLGPILPPPPHVPPSSLRPVLPPASLPSELPSSADNLPPPPAAAPLVPAGPGSVPPVARGPGSSLRGVALLKRPDRFE